MTCICHKAVLKREASHIKGSAPEPTDKPHCQRGSQSFLGSAIHTPSSTSERASRPTAAMKSVYQCPGMFSYPFPAGPHPLFDATNHQYFYGFMPPADAASQPLYPYPQGGRFYSDGYCSPFGLEGSFEGLALNPGAQEFAPPQRSAPEVVAALPAAWNSPPKSSAPSASPDRPRSHRPSRPGKGFFSSGRVEAPCWRQRAPASPDKQSKTVNKGNSNNVKRTIYITDVDQQVTEEQLAVFFKACGEVVDCRVCGDPNSAMRFAFIEFISEEAAEVALNKNGALLGDSPLRVLPSKTAIVPVNNQYLPKNIKEREQCSRTVYAANIDKKVDRDSVKLFFETLCGPVNKIRLLGDWQHATRIAFVEFVKAESAKNALSCSGALLGSLPVRVSPSKTPVRDDSVSADKPQGSQTSHLQSSGPPGFQSSPRKGLPAS